MTIPLDDTIGAGAQKNGHAKPQASSANYALHTDKRGQYYHHPQHGRVKVVALHCNCGRVILVRPAEAKRASIMCRLCNSPFVWQQLTFTTD